LKAHQNTELNTRFREFCTCFGCGTKSGVVHGENDFVASTKRLSKPQQTRIVEVTILLVTVTIVIVVTIHIVVTIEIVTTTILVC